MFSRCGMVCSLQVKSLHATTPPPPFPLALFVTVVCSCKVSLRFHRFSLDWAKQFEDNFKSSTAVSFVCAMCVCVRVRVRACLHAYVCASCVSSHVCHHVCACVCNRRREGAAGLEDGTAHYLGIAALSHGFRQLASLGGFPAIARHTQIVTRSASSSHLATEKKQKERNQKEKACAFRRS